MPTLSSPPPAKHQRRPLLILVGLLLATLIAYLGVGQSDFVNLDDDAYVQGAPLVQRGLQAAPIVWAWTAVHTANWHPLTTMSHMLDCDLFGVRPQPMHWENLAWHLLNAAVVFLLWRRLTGATWRSAIVAGLFALHPLHVESVAWISSRKDLLSTGCWLVGIAAYIRWTNRPGRLNYLLVLLSGVAALLFKPMAVTFPCTLLLLDFWPLRRWPRQSAWKLFGEKLPLFVVVLVHSALTFYVQYNAGAANYAERIALGARLGNALVSYVRYLGKTFWPESLAPLYWHPGYWPWVLVLAAATFLAGFTWLAWRQRTSRPWLAFGWLWFLGTLVPVIGIIQVGVQAMADRYTYVPLLGIFTILAWGGAELTARFRLHPRYVVAIAAAVAIALIVLTQRQVRAWRSSLTLYEHSLRVGEDNAAIRYLYATALAAQGRPVSEVTAQYQHALRLAPDYVNAHTQLALLALRQQRPDEALQILERTVRLEPRNPGLHVNLGAFWVLRGDFAKAHVHLQDALRLAPHSAGVHREIALLHMRLNQTREAQAHYTQAVSQDPWNATDLTQLGILTFNLGDAHAARAHLARALWIEPGNQMARDSLAIVDRAPARQPAR